MPGGTRRPARARAVAGTAAAEPTKGGQSSVEAWTVGHVTDEPAHRGRQRFIEPTLEALQSAAQFLAPARACHEFQARLMFRAAPETPQQVQRTDDASLRGPVHHEFPASRRPGRVPLDQWSRVASTRV
ncbi:hypothetical protein ACWD6R_33270 [Streptomyces sp. NPDC005151]